MESILMGFALLIAKDNASLTEIILGAVLAIPHMYYMGGVFTTLWIIAILLGRRGEAIKASLIAQRDKNGPN
jgi:hypothetical protein